MLHPSKKRFIRNPHSRYANISFVPGGRYLVSCSLDGICVWDLGYTSNADPKLLASLGPSVGARSIWINTTSDRLGLIIMAQFEWALPVIYLGYLRMVTLLYSILHVSVYEIYPQSKTPQLTQVAHLNCPVPLSSDPHLLPNKIVWHGFYQNRIIFTVWDYRLNHSTTFSADVNPDDGYTDPEVHFHFFQYLFV